MARQPWKLSGRCMGKAEESCRRRVLKAKEKGKP